MYMYIGRLQDTSLFASFRSAIPVLLVLLSLFLRARECLSRLCMPLRLIVVGHINFALSFRLSVRPGLSG
jgi:hypothetical protein